MLNTRSAAPFAPGPGYAYRPAQEQQQQPGQDYRGPAEGPYRPMDYYPPREAPYDYRPSGEAPYEYRPPHEVPPSGDWSRSYREVKRTAQQRYAFGLSGVATDLKILGRCEAVY